MKVYLAGPGVFCPDVVEWAESARALCSRYGYEPLTPLDHDETEAPKISSDISSSRRKSASHSV